MESIRETAQIYYEVVSANVRTRAKEFFKKMDSNNDGKVSMAEFAGFMTEERYVAMNNTSFFETINKNKNGKLDFDDVKTLFYILESGRPLCGGCRKFIKGMYFTCLECFTFEDQSFCLHRECFRSKNYVHNQEHSNFVDNYALLEFIRSKRLLGGDAQKNKSSKPSKPKPSTSESLAIVVTSSKPSKHKPSTSESLAIVSTSSKPSKPKPSTSESLAIVSTSSKPSKHKPSTSESLAIVSTSSKPSKPKPSTSKSLAIVSTRDERKVARGNLLAALGMTANLAGIIAAAAQCTIL